MRMKQVFRLIAILGLGGCITLSLGCAAGRVVTDTVGFTDEADAVDLEEQVEATTAEMNPYVYDSESAKHWMRKTWALLEKMYDTSADATSMDARTRALRDADATGTGNGRGDFLIITAEAKAGYEKTFRQYQASLGKHPGKKKQTLSAATQSQ